MLWGTVARALLEEIRRLIQSAAPVRQEDVARITTSLDRVMGAMGSLAYNSPLMGEWWRVTGSQRAWLTCVKQPRSSPRSSKHGLLSIEEFVLYFLYLNRMYAYHTLDLYAV